MRRRRRRSCAGRRGSISASISCTWGSFTATSCRVWRWDRASPSFVTSRGSVLSRAVYRIAEKLLAVQPSEAQGGPWAASASIPEQADAGFPAAESEAEADFLTLRRDLEDLLHTGALTMGDLVEAVRTQQLELATLRRENALLRARAPRATREDSKA